MNVSHSRKGSALPRTDKKIQTLTLCGLFTALVAIGAFIQITIPVQPLPMHFTLQFYFALLAGFLLGGKYGSLSVGIYLLIGLCGIPVFAAGGGPSYLLRPTFGFLLGFFFTAAVVGRLTEIFRPKGRFSYLAVSMAGFAVMYLSGNLYYYFMSNYVLDTPVPWSVVIFNCFLLTAAGDFLLCVLASLTARRLDIIMKRFIH